MIIPSLCFCCGEPIAGLENKYRKLLKENASLARMKQVLDLELYCCLTALKRYISRIDQILNEQALKAANRFPLTDEDTPWKGIPAPNEPGHQIIKAPQFPSSRRVSVAPVPFGGSSKLGMMGPPAPRQPSSHHR